MQPYERQKPVIDTLIKALLETGRALNIMATGLGKTPISAFISKEIEPKKILILCHRGDILEQTERETFSKVLPGYTSSFFNGDVKNISGDIVFANFQSMKNCLNQFNSDMFDMIIVDESHRSKASTYEKVLSHFKPEFLLGMTATKERMDGLSIEDIFGEAVVDIGLTEGISSGWLTPFKYKVLSDYLNDEIIKEMLAEVAQGVRLTKKDVNKRLFIKNRDEEIAKKIIAENKKAIIFCKNIRHANKMTNLFQDAKAFHSQLSDIHNDAVLKDFRSGNLQHIVTVDKMNEGIHITDVEMIVFLRSTTSKTVFTHQLGRALSKKEGKQQVLVLDFVANVNRIILIESILPQKIEWENQPSSQRDGRQATFDVSGEGYSFNFGECVLNVRLLLGQLEKDFYETWQEASKAAIELGVESIKDYKSNYLKDCRLPSNPSAFYSSFPTWMIFLRKDSRNYYKTWQEASQATIALNIQTSMEYKEKYFKDILLPSHPESFYSDFPDFPSFLGKIVKNYYPTLLEASEAVIVLEIQTAIEYKERYKEDCRLPSCPNTFYPDFISFPIFLGKRTVGCYLTWQEASKASISLGIKTMMEYRKSYSKDFRLPSTPHACYKNFPGDTIFFGNKVKDYYPTWQEASKATIALGIRNQKDYKKQYKNDLRLPCQPYAFYENYPGMGVFLGKKNQGIYKTWQEASKATIALGIEKIREYPNRYKEDPRLPEDPYSYYADLSGWRIFLGK